MKTKFNFIKLQLSVTLALLITTAFVSCKKEDSKDVSQDKIYAEYELFYDKGQDKTYASAIFKFSNALGTQLQLTSPSEVRFGSDIIPYDPVFAYYRKEYAGLITTGNFTFKDTNGKSYVNTVSVSKIITNPAIDTIKRTGAFTYNWIGDNVSSNELIGLTIVNVTNPANFQLFLQGAVGSTNLILPLTQLNQLPVGMSYCQLDRQIETVAPNVTSAGGKIRGKYRAVNTNLYIK